MVILMSITGKLPLTLLLMMVIVSAGSLIQLQPASATFPGANGKIVFSRIIGTLPTLTTPTIFAPTPPTIPYQLEIFTVNPDGSGLTQLTSTGPGMANSYPRWSADGTKIVFSSFRTGVSAIWVMNANGSGQNQITHPPPSTRNYEPAFSPDGSKIVFTNASSTTTNIWVTNVDGSNQKQLTIGSETDTFPVWSPDGSKIAFMRYPVSGNEHIFVMNPDGSGQTDISKDPTAQDYYPEWSPNGGMIAFSSFPSLAIWVMNADGSGRKQLSTPPNGVSDFYPAWSPDGTKIAFARGELASIIVMNADGSNPTDITQSQPNSTTDTTPNWQPLFLPPPARPVGGVTLPTNKLEILTPSLTLAGLAAAVSAVVVVKRRRD